MGFYASAEFFRAVSQAYYDGKRYQVEDIQVDGVVVRALVVEGHQVVTSTEFLDYHQPIEAATAGSAKQRACFFPAVSRGVVEVADWNPERYPGIDPAPFVDWSRFATFENYIAFVRQRNKGLLREYERRRRRLAETVGELTFCVDDERDDVFERARLWKGEHLKSTGHRDYFDDPKNVRYFEVLREAGVLRCSTLRAGGRLLAIWIGFIHEGVWSGWVFTYDPDPVVKKFSPGHQLLRFMLEESHYLGHSEFDFSIGSEDYKWLYATHTRLICPVGLPPLSQRLRRGTISRAKKVLSRYPVLARALRGTGLAQHLRRL